MDVSIAVPIHTEALSRNETLSLRRMQKVFHRRHFTVVCPSALNGFVAETFKSSRFRIVNFQGRMFSSIRAYNRLLTDIRFYQQFKSYSHVLICQPDVLVIRDDLDDWLQTDYDFVGAPIFVGYENSREENAVCKTSLNGGFSLRCVSSAVRVLERVRGRYSPLHLLYSMEDTVTLRLVRVIRDGLLLNYKFPHLLRPVMNEDLYWSFIVPRLHRWFNVPNPDIASYFAFDVHPRLLFNKNAGTLPMAIHAWWKYDPSFVETVLAGLD